MQVYDCYETGDGTKVMHSDVRHDGERTLTPDQPHGTRIGRYRVPDLTDLFAGYDGNHMPHEDGFTAPAGRETL